MEITNLVRGKNQLTTLWFGQDEDGDEVSIKFNDGPLSEMVEDEFIDIWKPRSGGIMHEDELKEIVSYSFPEE
jgi:hypothetical protein